MKRTDNGLSPVESYIIEEARRAYLKEIERHGSDNALALAITGISGLFADILTASTGAADLVALINQQLAGTGYQLLAQRPH
jgi:hypothetical protein